MSNRAKECVGGYVWGHEPSVQQQDGVMRASGRDGAPSPDCLSVGRPWEPSPRTRQSPRGPLTCLVEHQLLVQRWRRGEGWGEKQPADAVHSRQASTSRIAERWVGGLDGGWDMSDKKMFDGGQGRWGKRGREKKRGDWRDGEKSEPNSHRDSNESSGESMNPTAVKEGLQNQEE